MKTTNQVSFRIQLSENKKDPESPSLKIVLSETGELDNRIQILRATTIHDRRYGKVDVTPKMLSEMVKNFKANVRGIELMIDYSHNSDGEAAGWIESLELSEDGKELWAVVDWTPSGRVALQEKKFRYISADFEQNYRDNETMKNHGTVLLGAGLTNRPVIKRMKPTTQLGEKPMDEILKKLMAMLGIEDETQLEEKVSKLLADCKEMGEMKKKMGEMETASADKAKEVEGLKTELAEAKASIKLSEKNNKFNILLAEGKVVEAQRDAFVADDMIKFAETAGKTNTKPAGHGKHQDDDAPEGNEAEDKIIELSEAMAKEKKISIVEAQKIVLSENKELADKYYGRN